MFLPPFSVCFVSFFFNVSVESEGTTYWCSLFSVNQWRVEEELGHGAFGKPVCAPRVTNEQWPKSFLFAVYRGLCCSIEWGFLISSYKDPCKAIRIQWNVSQGFCFTLLNCTHWHGSSPDCHKVEDAFRCLEGIHSWLTKSYSLLIITFYRFTVYQICPFRNLEKTWQPAESFTSIHRVNWRQGNSRNFGRIGWIFNVARSIWWMVTF